MEAASIELIIRHLQRQQEEMTTKANSLRIQLQECDAHLSRISNALSALTGEPDKASRDSLLNNGRKKLKGQSPKKIDVLEVMTAILNREGVVEREALKSQVEAELIKNGFNRFGFAMRFKEACNDKLFVETPAGYRIADEKSTKAPFRSDESTTCYSSGATATQSDNSITSFTGAIKGNSTTASKGSTTTRSSN